MLRDGFLCKMCAINLDFSMFANSPSNQATEDHIIPRSKGGSDKFSNRQLICRQCNSKKGNRVI